MAMNFGQVGFRLSTSISLPKAKEKLDAIIRQLRARRMTDCIEVKEQVNRDALRQYGEERVNAVGAVWRQKDEFWYEPAQDKVDLLQLPYQGAGL